MVVTIKHYIPHIECINEEKGLKLQKLIIPKSSNNFSSTNRKFPHPPSRPMISSITPQKLSPAPFIAASPYWEIMKT